MSMQVAFKKILKFLSPYNDKLMQHIDNKVEKANLSEC